MATPDPKSPPTADRRRKRLAPVIDTARPFLEELDPWVLERQMELSSIPAPPFGEGPRGERMARLLEEAGLTLRGTDEAGNVLAEHPADTEQESPDPGAPEGEASDPVVLSAHLDTVFPAGTDVSPRKSGALIRGPGIIDDARGLAALLGAARALVELPLRLPFPVLFVATVGEEGVGDLRGVRYLFREGGEGRRARAFISLDGVGLDRVIARGVGSLRVRLRLSGSGGHSWTDWGLPNPIHALGRLVAEAQDLPTPPDPRTTLTVARWGGGQSINAIPQEAWVDVDLRSEGAEELRVLEEGLLALARDACRIPGPASSGRGGDGLVLAVQELGRRPSGVTDPGSPLVMAALEATRALGVEPLLSASSTDANVPMSLGIPAITLGAGGTGGGTHTLDEWYRNDKGPEGILRTLLTLVLLG